MSLRTLLIVYGFLGQLPAMGQASLPALNGMWSFKTDLTNTGETQHWYASDYKQAGWDSLPVPGNWDLRNEYAHYVGKAWYRKTFQIPNEVKGKTLLIHFDAVYHDCQVWLNGKKLGENHSGFLPFEFEVSSVLNYGGQNTLVVCADNTFKRGAIWNWGGIRRPVTWVVSDGVRIVRQHITPTVDLKAKTASVAVRVFLQNHTGSSRQVQGAVTLHDTNSVRKTLPFLATIPANGTQEVVVQTNFAKAETHLWHFDDPYLYTSEVVLENDSTTRQTNRFGLRKIEVDNQNYAFKLNGESIRPMGFNLVPDDRTTGNTLPLWRIKEDVDLLKSIGGNLARLSHLPLPEEMLDYLNERGMLVVSEIPLWGFDPLADPASQTSRDWLTRLITNQYNHPCIVAWSVGNEIGDYPTTMPYIESSIAYVRTLDSTRLATAVSHTAQRKPDFIQFTDIGLINKYGKNLGPITHQQHTLHPDKLFFYSEYGIGQLSENLDATLDAKVLIDSIRHRSYLIGASLWTFNDYRSNFYGTKEFSENRPWGVVDVFRRKKQAYYAFRKEHSPVREFTVNLTGATSARLRIVPRQVLDLPAFPLHGYRMVWKLTDAEGKIQQGGFEPLPDIKPGDTPLERTLKWTIANAFSLNVALLTPQHDNVYDTTIFFRKPIAVKNFTASGVRTQQNNTPPGSGSIRVFFEKTPTTTAYKVRYGTDGLTQETTPTIENFIDVPKLEFGKTYQVALVSINGAGESTSPVQSVAVKARNYAPPIIRHVEPADGGFFVGYATADDDFLFRVQVTTKPGDYAKAQTIASTTPGVLFVPGLENGKTYYFRVQRYTDNNSASLWTNEFRVVPDGGQKLSPPEISGIIRQGKEALVYFQTLPKATGYELQYRVAGKKTGEWQTQIIQAAQVEHGFVNGLNTGKQYEFRLAAINANGKSDYSTIVPVK